MRKLLIGFIVFPQLNELKGPTLRVYPLYAQLSQNRQMDVFVPTAPKQRKVILSTNIAETSLTIPGIKYVIDSGRVKRRVFDSKTGMDTLKIIRISQDQAWYDEFKFNSNQTNEKRICKYTQNLNF